MAAVLVGKAVILNGPVPMMFTVDPGVPSFLPTFSTNALDRIGANGSAFATSGSGFFRCAVTSLLPVTVHEPTLAK